MEKPLVGIIMGSGSDIPVMEEAVRVLEQFGVPHEIRILSAHRTPDESAAYAKELSGRGIKVLIAGAGWLPAPSWFGRLPEVGTALLP